jgi:glycosyltransferase involved in cell wall biosynthesis
MTAPQPQVVEVLGTSAGGVGVHVRSLVTHLVARGWTVTVAAPDVTQALFDFAGARVVTVPIRGAGRELLAVPALRRAVRGAAIVHAHGLRAGTAAVLTRATIRPSRRVPLVVTWHNAVLATGVAGRLLGLGERLVAGGAGVNLGVSADLVERIRILGGRDVRLAPVPPPLPVPVRTRDQVRAELGLGPGRALVVCVARLHHQKGLDVLLDAATRLAGPPPVGPPLVVIAGDGPLRAELQAGIERTQAPVRLLGRRDDVADLLAAADLVVLPSRWEGSPLVLQEAMALGRPVVATDVGGVAGLAGDGARLVPADDPGALAAAMGELLGDPRERSELGVRAAAVASTWPDERASAATIDRLYRELIGASSAAEPGDGPELLG